MSENDPISATPFNDLLDAYVDAVEPPGCDAKATVEAQERHFRLRREAVSAFYVKAARALKLLDAVEAAGLSASRLTEVLPAPASAPAANVATQIESLGRLDYGRHRDGDFQRYGQGFADKGSPAPAQTAPEPVSDPQLDNYMKRTSPDPEGKIKLSKPQSLHQQMVEQFMRQAGQAIPNKPTVPSKEVRRLMAKLIFEEAVETIQALGFSLVFTQSWSSSWMEASDRTLDEVGSKPVFVNDRDCNLTNLVKECCDLRVVTTGTLSACGVFDAFVQQEVDEANLRKFDPPVCRHDGSKPSEDDTNMEWDEAGHRWLCPVCKSDLPEKCGPYKREDGKWVKPPYHKGPEDRIGYILKHQANYDYLPGTEMAERTQAYREQRREKEPVDSQSINYEERTVGGLAQYEADGWVGKLIAEGAFNIASGPDPQQEGRYRVTAFFHKENEAPKEDRFLELVVVPSTYLDILKRRWYARIGPFTDKAAAPGNKVRLWMSGELQHTATITKVEPPGDDHGIPEFRDWWKVFWE